LVLGSGGESAGPAIPLPGRRWGRSGRTRRAQRVLWYHAELLRGAPEIARHGAAPLGEISREIFSQPALQKHIRAICFPGGNVQTQQDYEDFARQFGRTSYHPVGTCKMGTNAMSVVDPQCRVHGLDGLRICDSSIMPSLIGSNTNAATIMIAEKASDLVRGNR